MASSYLEDLEVLKDKWQKYLEFHYYLHEGDEHLHSLAEEASELQKFIVRIYSHHGIEKIGKYTESGMIEELDRMKTTPPREYFKKGLDQWDIQPVHDVLTEIDCEISRRNKSQPKVSQIEPVPLNIERMLGFDGYNWVPLTDSQMNILNKLNTEPGAWVLGKFLKTDPAGGERPDKIIKSMPPNIRNRIVSHMRKGYRLKA